MADKLVRWVVWHREDRDAYAGDTEYEAWHWAKLNNGMTTQHLKEKGWRATQITSEENSRGD